MVTARGWCGEEKEKTLFSGYRISIWEEKKFWRWMVVVVVLQQCELISDTEMYTKNIEMLHFVTYILTQ